MSFSGDSRKNHLLPPKEQKDVPSFVDLNTQLRSFPLRLVGPTTLRSHYLGTIYKESELGVNLHGVPFREIPAIQGKAGKSPFVVC